MVDNDTLPKIHEDINVCRACQALTGFFKPAPMVRGGAALVMCVGQGPGKTEQTSGAAFSGPAGKRLLQWLTECGADPEEPRKDVYLTSIIKCCGGKKSFQKMSSNCRNFLRRQLSVVKPKLVISLGKEAYQVLTVERTLQYSDALFMVQNSEEHLLIPVLDVHYQLLAWPHPSGLNRLLNDEKVQNQLTRSFEIVKAVLSP